MIEVGEAQECLDCFEISQGQPPTDCVGLGSAHGNASGGDHETQELNPLHMKQALLRFGVQVILTKVLQDTSDMDLMIFQGVREYEDIIKIDHYEYISHVSEDVVHEGLEGSG